jgi:DNA-binding transcriptional MerR regulator
MRRSETFKSLEGQAMPQHSPQWRIGEAATRSGVSAANIRYYEREGLLPASARTANSYRAYSEQDVHQLRFIRMCRAMDMSLDEVRALLSLNLGSREDCAVASDTLDEHLGHVRSRLAELKALEKDLKALRERCDGTHANCHIIEALHARAEMQDVPPGRSAAKRHV